MVEGAEVAPLWRLWHWFRSPAETVDLKQCTWTKIAWQRRKKHCLLLNIYFMHVWRAVVWCTCCTYGTTGKYALDDNVCATCVGDYVCKSYMCENVMGHWPWFGFCWCWKNVIGWEETARNRASPSTIFSHFLILSGSVKLQLFNIDCSWLLQVGGLKSLYGLQW